MKRRKTGVLLICASMLMTACFSGCSGNGGSADNDGQNSAQSAVESTAGSTDENNAANSMEGSDGNKTDNSSESSTKKSSAADTSKAESSAQQESSISEQQQKTEQAKKDIAVLMEYKKKIPQVSEQDITYKTSSISKNDVRGEVYYVDSVIRDINNDGRMELIVKYDCTFDDNSFGYRSCYLYDLVSVVNGEAVATERYKDESWFIQTVH